MNIKNCITTYHFYAISCDHKSGIGYLSISALSNVQCTVYADMGYFSFLKGYFRNSLQLYYIWFKTEGRFTPYFGSRDNIQGGNGLFQSTNWGPKFKGGKIRHRNLKYLETVCTNFLYYLYFRFKNYHIYTIFYFDQEQKIL